MNWSEGYYTGAGCTHGYHRHLNPSELRLAVLSGGFAPTLNEDFNYLELGFGQGASIGFHAAATGGTYWGTDLNPAHAANASALTAASGAHAYLSHDSFWEFASRTDLPEFDYIALNGVWSWVSEENRDIIVDLIRRKLKPGGIAYVSYNTYPGWTPHVPIRQLMALFSEQIEPATGEEEKVSGALRFATDVINAGSGQYRELPAVARHLQALTTHDHRDIAHEYLNADWKLSTFSETSARLGRAKLTYAGTTRLLDSIESFRFTPDSQEILDRIDDPVLRETTKDFLTNERLRSDVYVKGARQPTDEELTTLWSEQQFVLTTHKNDIPKQIVLPPGTIHLGERVPGDVIDALADNSYAPKTIAQLCNHPKLHYAQTEDVIAAMLLLAGAGHASTAQTPTAEIVDRCRKLNRYVCDRALIVKEVECLASPITGGAIQAPHVYLLFLNAIGRGRSTAQELTTFVCELLQSADQRLRKNGKGVDSRKESLTATELLAERFLNSFMPMCKALQVV